jgi:peptidoglycan/LPS O-acetylase OafA/YrhL
MLPSGILNVNGPLWSLFLEWWLYISGLFTLIAVLDLRTKFLKLMILALALVPLAYLYHIFKIPGLFYIAIWYSGLVISFCTPMFQKIIISLCLVFLLLYFLFSKLNMVEMYRTDEILWGGVSFILSIIFIFSAFHLSLNKIFFRLARFSYTLYIFHFPFIVFCHALSRKIVKHDLLNSMLLCVVLFAASIYLSSLLGRLGENKARYSRLIQNLIKFVSQINALQNRQSKILTK